MDDCLFCKIIQGEIPSEKVLETEDVYAFKDVRPQAPVHVLLIPKKHITSAHRIEPEDAVTIGNIHLAAQRVAEELGIDRDGYRLVTNVGEHGQQTVFHLHYHLLGGRQLQWPPG